MSALNVLGLHYRNTKNIGDRNCHPLDYVNLVSESCEVNIVKADVRSIPDDFFPDVVVFGGGAIAPHSSEINTRFPQAIKIAWGIGHTTGNKEIIKEGAHKKYQEGFSLYGTRDYKTGGEYTPCSSCLSNLFDYPRDPTEKVVVYGHAGKMPLKDYAERHGLPYMDNTQHKEGLSGVVRHLSRGEKIITSSYHGAFWSSLLGRKVSMIPFGSKFYNLKHVPFIAESFEEALGSNQESMSSNILEDYRAHVYGFQNKFLDLVKQALAVDSLEFEKKYIEDIM